MSTLARKANGMLAGFGSLTLFPQARLREARLELERQERVKQYLSNRHSQDSSSTSTQATKGRRFQT